MQIAYTRPRRIVASDVRQGDQLATYVGTGMLAGLASAELNDPAIVEWVDVDRYSAGYDSTPQGVVLADGTVKRRGPLDYVVIREVVTFDA